jgi:hypothetical protein
MRMRTGRGSRLVATIISGVVLAAGIGAPAYAVSSTAPAQVAATLTAATPGMARVIVAIGGGHYEAAVYDKAGHIDFWKYSGSKWAEVGRSSYPRIQQGPTTTTLETVVGRQLTGMSDATFITTGGFTGDSTGNAIAFGRGPRGWGTMALEPGNVLVPTGNGSTNNDTPGIFFNEDFSGGQLETIVENPYFSTASGSEFPLVTYWSWDNAAAHFVDARDNLFVSHSVAPSPNAPTPSACPKTPLNGTYQFFVQVGTPVATHAGYAQFGLPVVVHAIGPHGMGKATCASQVLAADMPIVVDADTKGDKSDVWITAPAWLLDVPAVGGTLSPLTVQSGPAGTTPWMVPPSLHIATVVSNLGVSGQNGGQTELPVAARCTFAHGAITAMVVTGTV